MVQTGCAYRRQLASCFVVRLGVASVIDRRRYTEVISPSASGAPQTTLTKSARRGASQANESLPLPVRAKRNCLACQERRAVALHKLKIRMSREKPVWALPLCRACLELLLPLGPVAELLWFQSMGVDALALASAGCRCGGEAGLTAIGRIAGAVR